MDSQKFCERWVWNNRFNAVPLIGSTPTEYYASSMKLISVDGYFFGVFTAPWIFMSVGLKAFAVLFFLDIISQTHLVENTDV